MSRIYLKHRCGYKGFAVVRTNYPHGKGSKGVTTVRCPKCEGLIPKRKEKIKNVKKQRY